MFRSKKKKIHSGSRRAVRAYNYDDDEKDVDQVGTNGVRSGEVERLDVDEPPSALLITAHQRKIEKRNKKRAKSKIKIGSGGPVVRSFDIEETDDNDDDNQKKQKKKRKRGLGFGGGDNSIDIDEDCKKNGEMGSLTINTYGKEVLEQLKSEQKQQTVTRAPLQSTTSPNTKSLNIDPKIRSNFHDIHNPPEESFISLEDLEEENERICENHSEKKERVKKKIFVVDNPLPDEPDGWERQIEQRAGLKTSSISSHSSKRKLLSLDELSQNLRSTVETIDRQREELENSTNRLRADREHAITNSKEQHESLRRTGLACEFYQSTRRDLTVWVGALRDLQEKIQPIAAAFREMLQIQTNDFGNEFRAWQDDCVATLYQNKRLDRVLGRQPDSTLLTKASNEIVYDEFGRDVRSQYLRDRDLRFKERIEHIDCNKSTNSCSSTNNGIIKREDHNEEERSKILHEALSAALEDLDQEYTSATPLKLIFDGWFAAYFDDYQQCFATLSFGDLYAVLVQVELCKSSFFPDVLLSMNDNTSKSSTSSSKSFQRSKLEFDHCFLDPPNDRNKEQGDTEKYKTSKVVIENEGRLARAVEKGVFPILVNILNNAEGKDNYDPFYLFFSSAKSSLISKLISDVALRPLQQGQNCTIDRSSNISNSKSSSNNLREQLQNLVSTAIKNALDGISIPLLNKDSNESGCDDENSSLPSPTEASKCSVKFAGVYLAQILQQALCNIIVHWFPLIDLDMQMNSSSDGQAENSIHYVLNFINEKYLVLLSSIENAEETSSVALTSAKAFFKPIWEALNTESRNIVELPSLMLSTMPLRAAARAYQLY